MSLIGVGVALVWQVEDELMLMIARCRGERHSHHRRGLLLPLAKDGREVVGDERADELA